MHAFRISECYLDFSCMDAIGPLNLAVFRTDEIHRHNSRPQLCKPINLLQFMRAAQLSYRLNRWNVRLRNVRLTSTRSRFGCIRKVSTKAGVCWLALWPRIKYGHIFGYFIIRTYTQEQLLSWKQLEAYNFF